MKHLLMDTGYLIALDASDDQNHVTALAHWQISMQVIAAADYNILCF